MKFEKVDAFENLKSLFVSNVLMEVFKCDMQHLTVEYGLFLKESEYDINFIGTIPVKYEHIDGFKAGIFSGRR